MAVNSHCLVTFSLGAHYTDSVLWDVVDSKYRLLIFGLPWIYDLDAKYSGRENVYRFTWKNTRIVMTSLPPKKVHIACSATIHVQDAKV